MVKFQPTKHGSREGEVAAGGTDGRRRFDPSPSLTARDASTEGVQQAIRSRHREVFLTSATGRSCGCAAGVDASHIGPAARHPR